MRVYTLRCSNCRHVFDVSMLLSEYIQYKDNDSILYECPKCKEKMHPTRVILNVPVIFSGEGFYSTDNRQKEK